MNLRTHKRKRPKMKQPNELEGGELLMAIARTRYPHAVSVEVNPDYPQAALVHVPARPNQGPSFIDKLGGTTLMFCFLDWNTCGPLLEECGLCVQMHGFDYDTGVIKSWKAASTCPPAFAHKRTVHWFVGDTPPEAVARAYLSIHYPEGVPEEVYRV